MIDVKATEIKIASGAARAAFAVSSDIWAAESSGYAILSHQAASKRLQVSRTTCQGPHWRCESQHKCPSAYGNVLMREKTG